MSDHDHLCVHGREIACLECVDDARAERLACETELAEIERLRAEVNGHRDGEAQEIVTLRNQLTNALDSLKYEHDRRLEAERERDEARASETRQYDQAVEATVRMLRAEQERDEARALNARSICVWCGTILPSPDGGAPEDRVRVMWEHAEHCDKRPEKRLADHIDALERDRDAEAENARLAQDRVARLTEGNLRLIGLLKSCRPYVETMSLPPLSPLDKTWVGARAVLARLDAALGGQP